MSEAPVTKDHPLSNPVIAFVVSLAVFGVLFIALDFALMRAQGLPLFFHG